MSSPRPALLALGGTTVGLAVCLAIPGDARALALFAYLLLLCAAALAVLARQTRRVPPVADEVWWRPGSAEQRRVERLEEIAQEVATVLELGGDPSGALGARLRVIARARLADRRGIDLDRQPQQARAAVGDELAWRLLQESGRLDPVDLPPLGPAELSRVVASLERI